MLDSFTKQALTYLDVRGDILRTSFTIKLSILILCAFEVSNTAYPLYNDSLNPEKKYLRFKVNGCFNKIKFNHYKYLCASINDAVKNFGCYKESQYKEGRLCECIAFIHICMEPVNLKHLVYNSYRIVCLFMFDHEILPLNMFDSFFFVLR